MGQTLKKLRVLLECSPSNSHCSGFPDLASWPPELSLLVLSHLNATDLSLAACVWQDLAQDDLLWQSLCYSQWGYTSIYHQEPKPPDFSYHKLYLQLDEGSVSFNADPFMGMDYLHDHGLVANHPHEMARFLFHTRALHPNQVHAFLSLREDVLDHFVSLYNFKGHFLSHALRNFLASIHAPESSPDYLHSLVEKFSARFSLDNPHLGLTSDQIYLLCFSLIMLSIDLASPHVKNKMSKREFIRNVRNAIRVRRDDELFGHLYDDVYLRGHVAPSLTPS